MLKGIGNYLFKLLIAIDQIGNVLLLNGSPDHTISGRVGYYSLVGKEWARVAEKVINTLFFWDKDHCYTSIEWYIVERDGIYKEHHKIDKEYHKSLSSKTVK